MANELIIPDLNPVKFVELNPATVPQYRSKRLEDYRFQDLIKPWNNRVKFFQKWQTSNVIKLQFESNFDPIAVDIIDMYGIVRDTAVAIKKRANKYLPGYYVYEVSMSLAAISPGCYDLQITLPDRVLISEPIKIAVEFKNTVLLKYRNTRYHGDVIFETGIEFEIRVDCSDGFLIPGSNNIVYEDQKLNPFVLSSKAYRSFPFTYGGTRGMPDWLVDKIFLIWTCNSVTQDGKSYAKPDDQKFEYKTTDRWQMRTMSVQLREGINRGSKIISPAADPNKRLLVVFPAQSRIFGVEGTDAADTVIRINGIE